MTHLVTEVDVPTGMLDPLRALPGVRVTTLDPIPLLGKPREWALDRLGDAEILVCTLPPTNQQALDRLRFVQLTSVGYAQLYGLDFVRRGVRAANARGVYDTAIAEWNIAMMINLARDLRTMIRNQECGRWEVVDRFASEIRGAVAGLWGYGGIGRETARLAKALGMQVHVMTRYGVGRRSGCYVVPGTGDPDGSLPDRTFGPGDEREFLAGLDFLILAMPLTPASTGLIGERELRALRPTTFLLNPARGPLVQEAALLRALDERWIAGAALDTHFQYPLPPEHPLWRMPRAILTPHISGSDRGPHYAARFREIVTHNARAFLNGAPLWNELTPDELNGK